MIVIIIMLSILSIVPIGILIIIIRQSKLNQKYLGHCRRTGQPIDDRLEDMKNG
jgi:hypothetical protein